MEFPKEFFTTNTLFTLSGSSVAVWIITSVIGDLMGINQKFKKWIGLILSLILALLGVTLLEDRPWLTWLVAVVNGFLIYLTAVGVNTVASPPTDSRGLRQPPIRETGMMQRKTRGRFLERWW